MTEDYPTYKMPKGPFLKDIIRWIVVTRLRWNLQTFLCKKSVDLGLNIVDRAELQQFKSLGSVRQAVSNSTTVFTMGSLFPPRNKKKMK